MEAGLVGMNVFADMLTQISEPVSPGISEISKLREISGQDCNGVNQTEDYKLPVHLSPVSEE
jgi:hypothetical protein